MRDRAIDAEPRPGRRRDGEQVDAESSVIGASSLSHQAR